MKKDPIATILDNPSWIRIGPYLYNTQHALLLVHDKENHLLEYLKSVYGDAGLPKDPVQNAHRPVYRPDDYTGDDDWNFDAEAWSYADDVTYSPEGYQIPPRTAPSAEERLLLKMQETSQRAADDALGKTQRN